MSDVSAFLQAIAGHWLALAGGAAIVVVLGVYERLAKRELPRVYYVGLMLLFVGVAIFQAWQDEYTRANELAAQIDKDRPYFRREATQIVPLRAVQGGNAIEGNQVATRLRNTGPNPAQHITVHILIADGTLKAPPIANYLLDSATGIGPGGPLLISKHMNIPPNAKPALLMFDVRYQSTQGRDYQQTFFSKFAGSSTDGRFESDLYEPPASESLALKRYASSYAQAAKSYETSQP